MVRSVLSACCASALCVFAISACGEKDDGGPADPHVRQANPSLASAPSAIQQLDTGEYCGRVIRNFRGEETGDRGARACVNNVAVEGRTASMTIEAYSVEGDPIRSTYVARSSGDLLRFVDTTDDAFGSRDWRQNGCPVFAPRRLRAFGTACARVNPVIDETTPSEVVERPVLSSCGRPPSVSPSTPRTQSPEIACARRAIARGATAELQVSRSGNHDETTDYIRFLGSEEIETFYLAGDSSDGDQTPGRWYRKTCSSFDAESVELSGCSTPEELDPA